MQEKLKRYAYVFTKCGRRDFMNGCHSSWAWGVSEELERAQFTDITLKVLTNDRGKIQNCQRQRKLCPECLFSSTKEDQRHYHMHFVQSWQHTQTAVLGCAGNADRTTGGCSASRVDTKLRDNMSWIKGRSWRMPQHWVAWGSYGIAHTARVGRTVILSIREANTEKLDLRNLNL